MWFHVHEMFRTKLLITICKCFQGRTIYIEILTFIFHNSIINQSIVDNFSVNNMYCLLSEDLWMAM